MWQLSKVSDPGWEKTFPSKEAAAAELRKWVCKACIEDEHVANLNDADELLATPCGCEFYLEDLQNAETQ